MTARRRWERRYRDARFFLVERRKGDWWKYGSIVLSVVLLGIVGWMYGG
jgi:hypothetical protein